MYLKRVVISGFKSFGSKTVIDFEPGVSAVVGPNGSGKSNVVEAIRWALGEQSARQLRSSGREELVFAGTDGRPRASMAEVALVFDNADGAFPLEVDEVEIARRIYRSGETEYRLMQRTARLADVQLLLAEAGMGADSFAVVAQGTIDAVLLASTAERTLMFEEASGIRSLELKRQAALRKLAAAAENTKRLRDMAAEIEPRLGELRKLAELAEEHEQVVKQLDEARRDYLAAVRYVSENQIRTLDDQQAKLQTEASRLKQAVRLSEQAAAAVERRAASAQADREQRQTKLAELDAKRAEAATVLTELLVAAAEAEAKSADLEKRLHEGEKARHRLDALERKFQTKQRALDSATEQVEKTALKLDKCGGQIADISRELAELPVEQLGRQAQSQVVRALQMIKMAAQHLDHPEPSPQQLRLLIHKAGRFLAAATKEAAAGDDGQLAKLQEKLERLMQQREELSEHHTNLVIAQRSHELDLQHIRSELKAGVGLDDELGELKRQQTALHKEIDAGRRSIKAAEIRLNRVKSEQAAAYKQAEPVDIKAAFELVQEAGDRRQELQKVQAELDALDRQKAAALSGIGNAAQLARDWKVEEPSAKAGDPLTLERQCLKLAERVDALSELSGGGREYREAESRVEHLSQQAADLERAEEDLRELVDRLGAGITERFKAGFSAINHAFEGYFRRLFDGGKAALKLEELSDGYGIELSVALPGKRAGSLKSLSGGERALTGVALLAALLSQSRSPFIVLDEVDAALDEANSGRFGEVLEELGKKSQLIVVTHNRQTMGSARNLYGVTLDRHNLSRVVSLRLDQARQLAARG